MTSRESKLTMTSLPSATAADSDPGSQQAVVIKGRRYRQRPLGPAPFASFEDLSDELDSPPETARVPLPGIKEDPASQIQTPNMPQPLGADISIAEMEDEGLKKALSGSLDTPAPPRIDISRASSSSQHEDSVTSSPDREGGNQNLGYKEDGTVDLRSSTEELDYIQEPGTVEESEAKRKREKMLKKQQQSKQDFCETQSEIDVKERKDSSCSVMSEVGLLCISGRTSRLSSIGSVASAGSVASGASHLSAGSHMSGRSTRSPSPHKMLLETSFCGSKPLHTHKIEAEAAPALVSHAEKQSSRPPSRLCSRSPSPHKMLLETSFCGAKGIAPSEVPEIRRELKQEKIRKKKIDFSAPSGTDDLSQKPQKIEPLLSPKINKEKVKDIKIQVKEFGNESSKATEVIQKLKKAKPVNLPKIPDKKLNYSKPKKIISIRDIPADEIYIPLKGPEVDLEEIIRKASPHLKKKVETQSDKAIFIPLHSPMESEKEKDQNRETAAFSQKFDDGIYIPLHSPPKSPKPQASQAVRAVTPTKIKMPKTPDMSADKLPFGGGQRQKKKPEQSKKSNYEICEDGSIFIPLHSPDEETRPIRNFEEEIKRVDKELQKAKELAEKRLQDEQKQLKPSTLDLIESGGNQQSLSGNKLEMTSGGSRTPSPGSTLSRKSSFASIFRRSDATSSPDSSGGSLARKKSGTFSSIIKDGGDGLRDKNRSRSKNRERQNQSPVTRSPSVKKNVFTSLFGKKKTDGRVAYGKKGDERATRLDFQNNFAAEPENKALADEGDYIIIPLRDPSDPHSQDTEGSAQDEHHVAPSMDKPPSPIVVLERCSSPKISQETNVKDEKLEELSNADDNKTSIKLVQGAEEVVESEILLHKKKSISESSIAAQIFKDSTISKKTMAEISNEITQRTEESVSAEKLSNLENASLQAEEEECKTSLQNEREMQNEKNGKKQMEATSEEKHEDDESGTSKMTEKDFRHESSLEMEEGSPKEEMLAVSTGGVRKLKLPPEPGDLGDDHERKGLVLQESFEDELPYIPTTLPLERSVGVPIIPVKHRVAEIKTCPIERPRSTTPINPSTLEEYVNVREPIRVSVEEKMKISLPREDSVSGKSKSPRRFSAKGKTWFEFAETVSQSTKDSRKSHVSTTPSPPPLPPRSSSPLNTELSTSAPHSTSSWINFEELPEKRKQPKRITTVPPIRSSADGGALPEKPGGASIGGNIIYSYVSPEDCQCECHDNNVHTSGSHSRDDRTKREGDNDDSASRKERETECLAPEGKLEVDRQSFLSDSSYECTTQDAENASEFDDGTGQSSMKPFAMDFDIKSNRSSVISQDDQMSPEEISTSFPP